MCSKFLRGGGTPLIIAVILFFSPYTPFVFCFSVEGKVGKIDYPIAIIETSNKTYFARLGPFWFWKDKNCTLSPGDSVRIEGWLMDSFVVPQTISVLNKNCTVRLRDSKGYPLWRGGRHRR